MAPASARTGSRGGLSTRIHVAVDGKGTVKTIRMSPGPAADYSEALALLKDIEHGTTVIGRQGL